MAPKARYGSLSVRIYRALIDPLLRSLRPKVVRVCRESGARRVVDIATATGAQCRSLARIGIAATGVDLSEAMVASAVRRGGPNTAFLRGSALALPFPDGSFDAALLVLALHEHPEGERSIMLREALRVVGPQGALIVAEFREPRRPRLHVPWRLVRLVEAAAGSEHRAGFRDFVARGSLDGLLERHGLEPHVRVSSHFGTIAVAVVRRPKPDRPTPSRGAGSSLLTRR